MSACFSVLGSPHRAFQDYLGSPFRHDLLSFMMRDGENRGEGARSAIAAEKEFLIHFLIFY
jgi:hypothetical protein